MCARRAEESACVHVYMWVCVGQLNWKMELKCESQLQPASQLENIAKKDSRRLRKKIHNEVEYIDNNSG